MKIILTRLAKAMFLSSLLFAVFSCNKDSREADKSPVIEKEFALTGFTGVYSISGFNVVITKGAGFRIKARGPSGYVNDIGARITGNVLDLRFEHNWRRRPDVDVTITLPVLEQFHLAGAGNGTINGFENEDYVIKAILSGASKGILNGVPANLAVDLSGGSQLDATGTTTHLYGQLSGGAKLNTYGLLANEVDIEASGGSEARVKAESILFATATGGSKIFYKGNPVTKHVETSGGGQVIQE